MDKPTYIKLLQKARQITRRADEAEDLLQAVLLAAVEAGRADSSIVANRRWLIGALRKRAMFDARSAVRRRHRETTYAIPESVLKSGEAMPTEFINALPPALRTTTRLALSGHTRKEITWLLRISDAALRQRIREIRRRWRLAGGMEFTDFPGLSGTLAFGQLRQTMLGQVRHDETLLASHDHDGHIFIVCSQNWSARQLVGKSVQKRGIKPC